MGPKDVAGEIELRLHMVADAVARIRRHAEMLEALLSDPQKLIELNGETDHSFTGYFEQLPGRLHAEHERDVGHFETAPGEVSGKGGLTRAAHTDKDEIRSTKIPRFLAVIALDGKFDRFDPPKILLG